MSYKVYAGVQTDVDTWETKVCIHDISDITDTKKLISPTLTREVGKAGSFEFTMPLGNVAHSALQKLRTTVEVEQDGVSIWQGRPMSHEQDFLLRQKVYCEGELAYLNDSALAPYTAKNVTVRDFLTFLCENHSQQVDAYKSFVCGNVRVGERYLVPVQAGCYFKQGSVSYDDDGNHIYDWHLMSKSGKTIVRSYFSDIEGDSTKPPSFSWAIGEPHYNSGGYNGGIVVTRTGDNLFSIMLNAVYSANEKTYKADISIKSAKIESALHSINFGNRAVFDMSEATIAPKISVTKKSDGRYEVSINGAVDPDFSVTEYDVLYDFGDGKNSGVTWDTLQDELVEKYGGYLIVRHSNGTRYLDYLDQITEKNPQPIAFGTNLLDLTSYVKAEDIVTRVVAVGKQTSGWFIWETTKTITATANDLTAQKLFGIITRVIVVDGTASTLQSLQDAADEELANNLRYLDGITVKAVDLKDAGIDIGRIGFGKMTHIYSGPHGVDTWLLCSKLVEPLDAPDKKEFTLGVEFSSISDLQALSARKAGDAYDLSRALKGYAVAKG